MAESGESHDEALGPIEVFVLIVLAVLIVVPPTAYGESAWISDVLLVIVAALASARRGYAPGLASRYMLAGAVVLAASHAGAADSHASWTVIAGWARLGLAFVVGAVVVTRAGALRRMHVAFAGLGTLAAVHAIVQLWVLFPRLLDHPEDFPVGFLPLTRATSVFVLPAHFGSFSAVAGVLSLALGLSFFRRNKRSQAVLAFFAFFAALLGTRLAASMGGFLCFSAGLAAFVLLSLEGRARRAVLLVGATMVLVLAALSYHQRLDEMQVEGPGSARLSNWQAAMQLTREEPARGHGGGGFLLSYPRVKKPTDNDVRHAHQIFLHAASEHGVFAIPLLFAVAASALSRAAREAARLRADVDGPLHAGLVGAAVALATFAFVDFGWVEPTWGIPAAMILGACHGVPLPRGRKERGALLPSAVAVSTLGVIVLSSSIPDSLAERKHRAALAIADQGDHVRAGELLAEAMAISPKDTTLMGSATQSAVARAMASRTRQERDVHASEALRLADRAIAASPERALLHSLRARALAVAGRHEDTLRAAERAVQLAPQVKQYREDLKAAQLAVQTESDAPQK